MAGRGATVKVVSHLPLIQGAVHKAVGGVVKSGTLMVETGAKVAIQTGAKTGRTYGEHQASAPGEAPASDIGHLADSIQSDVEQAETELYGEVTVGSEYGAALEYGSVHMAARPYLTPAAGQAEPKIQRAATSAVRKAAQSIEVKQT